MGANESSQTASVWSSERGCDEVVERESVWSGGHASERALNEKHVNIFFCDIHKVPRPYADTDMYTDVHVWL